MSKEEPTIILCHETVWQSLVSDAGTFCVVAGLIGLGWFLGSSAMQWVGFVMAILFLFARATGKGAKARKTIAEARQFLDELERKQT